MPLAIGMLARQLRHHPAWSAAGRAAELASARDRLELMETDIYRELGDRPGQASTLSRLGTVLRL